MENKKTNLGQFYTTKAEYILQDLLSYIPKSTKNVIDPFCGKWDLLNLIQYFNKVGYDIDPQNTDTISNNSFLNPPVYTIDDFIITNPPYLAKNKNKDKTVYQKYKTDDLYTASLKSIKGCNGGIIILPVGFFTSSIALKDRKDFLKTYKIHKVYIFEEKVFEDTDYTVCSFAFTVGNGLEDSIPFVIKPNNIPVSVRLNEDNDYTFGGEIFKKVKCNISVSRLLIGQTPNSAIKFYAIDSGSITGRIRMTIEEPYFGKSTDRAFATLSFGKNLSEQQQRDVVYEFNKRIEFYREKYNSLFLSNYRNSTVAGARKRMGFKQMYNIVEEILVDLGI